MENIKETFVIETIEKYGEFCIDDKNNAGKPKKRDVVRKPLGFVEIYELDEKGERKQIGGRNNLVVYIGREHIAQKILNVRNTAVTPELNEFICWLGLGDGGTAPGDSGDPIPTTNSDVDLNNAIGINATDSTCADFVGGFYFKHPIDSVVYEQDEHNDDAYLVARITVTIDANDANDEIINEAGLFMAASDAGGYAGPFNLFAKTTFTSIPKHSQRILIFLWYLYF